MSKQDKSTAYRYYFRGDISFGVHFFEAWVNAIQEAGVPMRMITFLNLRNYCTSLKRVNFYRSKGILIFPDLPFQILSTLYFIYLCFRYNKVVVHTKKRDTAVFDRLKLVFPNSLRYVYEGEGDPLSEADYLAQHPYKSGFYDHDISQLSASSKTQRSILKNADLVTFGYQPMKDMLVERYPDLNLDDKIVLVPMSFSRGKMYYSESVRNDMRKHLGIDDKLVFTYIGNVYYSWQNLFRSLELVLSVRARFGINIYILLLIKPKDHKIAEEFIQKLGLDANEYLLTSAEHDDIPKYLNASDFGMVLRHNHTMNFTTPSGKILDYLGCGLPVITTCAMGELSRIIKRESFGVVLENMDADEELMQKISPYLLHSNALRINISKWANNNIAIENYIKEYVRRIQSFAVR